MPDINKRIIFSAEDTGVESKIDQLKRSANELARDLIRDARAYSTSGKEVLQFIDDQIAAIEKRNKLEKESQLIAATQRATGALKRRGLLDIDKEQIKEKLKAEVGEIKLESEEDKLQTQLLRDIVETIKQTARSEIREDRKGVEHQIRSSERVGRLGIDKTEDEYETLKETLEEQFLGDVKTSEREQKEKLSVGRNLERGISTAAGIGLQQNPLYMISAAVGATIGFLSASVGTAATAVTNKLITSAAGYEQALGGRVAIGGGTMERFRGAGAGAAQFGISEEEYLRKSVEIARARGAAGGGLGMETMGALKLEKGLGLGAPDITDLIRVLRADIGGGGGATAAIQELMKAFTVTGVMISGDTSLTPELLKLLLDVNRDQVARLGEIDIGVNTRMVAMLSGLDESFKNPEVLRGVVAGIRGGLRQPTTPQVEALQFAALSRLDPSASLWELEKMRERDIATPEYFGTMLESLDQASVSNEAFFRNIKNVFGVSATMAEKIGLGFLGGGVDIDQITRLMAEEKVTPIDKRAREAAGVFAPMTAEMTNRFAEVGKSMVNAFKIGADKIVEAIEKDQPIRSNGTYKGIPFK